MAAAGGVAGNGLKHRLIFSKDPFGYPCARGGMEGLWVIPAEWVQRDAILPAQLQLQLRRQGLGHVVQETGRHR